MTSQIGHYRKPLGWEASRYSSLEQWRAVNFSPHALVNENRSTGPGLHTADGCAVDLYRVLAPRGEAEIITAAIPPGCAVLELGAGAGRVTHRLIAFGHAVWAVDASAHMLAAITGATTIRAEIAGLDLGRRFACVVLGSQLVNTVATDIRKAFLQTSGALGR